MIGRFAWRVSLAVLLLSLAACGTEEGTPTQRGLTFFHLNDTYRIGAVESGNAGGFGRAVTLIREAQTEGRDVYVLHGGDFLYPSLESQLWNGAQMVDAFNFMDAIAPMIVVAGNHEFDRRTPEYLVDAVRRSTFDWVGSNYRFDTGENDVDEALHRTLVFEHDGQKVGLFGLTLHPDDGGNARDYVPTDIDYLGAAEAALQELEAQGVDLYVGLTHLHIWQDAALSKLKADYPGLLFIVGGHEHEPEFIVETETTAAVMKGASNARVIWRIDVDFTPEGTPILVSRTAVTLGPKIASDPDYDALEAAWRGRLLEKFPFLTARVGEAAVPLDAREVTIRNVESNWGSFVVDQMRGAFGDPPADLAFINSGTLRIDDVISGQISFEDIGRTFGFSSYLRYMTLSGAEFRALLEAGYRGRGPSKGYFPQVSGFRVCVDREQPEGARIVSLQLPGDAGWQEIDAAAEYSVVVPDYLYGGGDGYRFPEGRAASRPGSQLNYLVLDAIMAAQARGEKVGGLVDPEDPRIVILSESDDACFPE